MTEWTRIASRLAGAPVWKSVRLWLVGLACVVHSGACYSGGNTTSTWIADLEGCYRISLSPHPLSADSIRAYPEHGGRPDWFFDGNEFVLRLDGDSLVTPVLSGLRVSVPATTRQLSVMHPAIWDAPSAELLDIVWWDGYDGIALFLVREAGWTGYAFFNDDHGCMNREDLPGCWRADAEAVMVQCPSVDWSPVGRENARGDRD